MTVTNKRVLAASVILGATVLIVWLYRRNKVSDDPRIVGQQYLEALLSTDANEVYRLTDHHEFEQNGMSKDDLYRFLHDWLRPKIIRVTSDSYDIYGTGSNGWQTFSWGIATTYGRFPISINVAKCDDGLRVVQPLSSLFVTFAAIKANHLPASGAEKLSYYSENARRMAPELARFHFTTIQVTPGSEPMTIEQFANWSDERLKTIQQAERDRAAYSQTHHK